MTTTTTKSRAGVANGGFMLEWLSDSTAPNVWLYESPSGEQYHITERDGMADSCTCVDSLAHDGAAHSCKHCIVLSLWLAGWRWDDPPRITHKPSTLKVGQKWINFKGACVVIDGVRGEYIRADRWVPDGVKARIGAVYAYDVWTRGADVPQEDVAATHSDDSDEYDKGDLYE